MYGYELHSKLADGSAAEVFLARDQSSDHRLILEVLRTEFLTDAATYGRFIDEAKARQTLDHPNLIRRQRFGCGEDGRVYAVTEPIRGEHLKRRLEAVGPLSARELCKVLIPVCEALHYLHERGQVHGALRPSSVYVDPSGKQAPKLLDTGLSLLRTSNTAGKNPLAGVTLVEPEYLAPERIGGRRGDALSDVYGLGVLMFELLTGAPPFSSGDPTRTRLMHLGAPMPRLPERCAALTPVVSRCLARKRRERFADVRAVALALGEALAELDAAEARMPRDDESTLELSIVVSDAPPPPPTSQKLAPGSELGSYILEGALGEGGMGQVFLARHRRLGRHVALKVLRPEQAADPVQLKRFFQEARALNDVQNPHIVRIHDVVEEPARAGGYVYLVMEALRGKTLRELAATEQLSIGRATRLMMQVCEALAAAHQVGVVHRDIKPANLFVVSDPVKGPDFVKVLDFGVAKLLSAQEVESVQMTQTGVMVGTPSFMAPEQACGDGMDHRADLYAVGTVLYSLLTGRPPFYAESLVQILSRLLTQAAPPLPPTSVLGEPIPDVLRRVVARCLERNPAARFSSARELQQALQKTLQG